MSDFKSFSQLKVPSELSMFFRIQMMIGDLTKENLAQTCEIIVQNIRSRTDINLLIKDISTISKHRPKDQDLFGDLLFNIYSNIVDQSYFADSVVFEASPKLLVRLYMKGCISTDKLKLRGKNDSYARYFLQPYIKFDRDWLKNSKFDAMMAFYDDLIENDYEQWKELSLNGVKPGQFGYILKNDLIDDFKKRIKTKEDIEKTFTWSPFEVPIDKDLITFAEASAFYGSPKIFEYVASKVDNIDNCIKYAIEGGNNEIIELCIKKNKRCVDNALIFAMQAFRFKLFEHFMQYNPIPPFTQTACELRNYPVFVYTTRNNFDPNYRINKKAYPLISIACESGDIHMVQYLLDEGANVNVKVEKEFPIHIAAANSSLEICKLLLEHGANVNEVNKAKQTPLHLAATSGLTAIIEFLVKKGATVDAVDDWGQTPLQLAAGKMHTDAVRLLISFGANVNITVTEKGKDYVAKNRTLLHFAATIADNDLVLHLINSGLAVDAEDEYRITPLLIAAENNFHDVCLTLIAHGANVNAKGSAALTPLHFAAQNGDLELVKKLVESGADVKAKGSDGFPIRKAKTQEIRQYLIEKMKSVK